MLSTKKVKIKICVDFREPDNKITKLKTILGEDSVEIVESEVGDYFTPDKKVGIERKSLNDYLNSMTGRLKQQLKELKDTFEHPYLFVEGNIDDFLYIDRRFHPNSIIGSVASVLSHSRVPIVFTGSFFIPLLIKVVEKHYDGKVEEYTPIRRARPTKNDYQLNILCSMPGINMVRAKALLQRFGSVEKVVTASVEELTQVKGIGEKIAKQIKGVVE